MKIVFKENGPQVVSTNKAFTEVPVIIPFEDLSQKRKNAVQWNYKVNNRPFEVMDSNKIKVEAGDIQKGEIILQIRWVNLSTGEKETYILDGLPVQHYVGFGFKITNAYPDIIQETKNELDALKKRVKNLEEEGDFL